MGRALSTEDGNLAYSIITSRVRVYDDIDLSFTPNRSADDIENDVPGDVYKKYDKEAVRQSVKNLLMTNYFEKPFMPFYGGNLNNLLFELSTTLYPRDITEQITNAIEAYEPRAKVLSVSATSENHDLNVSIEFQIVNTSETILFTTSLSRLR